MANINVAMLDANTWRCADCGRPVNIRLTACPSCRAERGIAAPAASGAGQAPQPPLLNSVPTPRRPVASYGVRSRAAWLEPTLNVLGWIVLVLGALGSVFLLVTGVAALSDPYGFAAGLQNIILAVTGVLYTALIWLFLWLGGVVAGYIAERTE